MPRTLDGEFIRGLEATASPELPIWFVTFQHPSLEAAVQVVDDVVDYIVNGVRYYGAPFELQFLTDADEPPRGRLSVQNVDQRIGAWFQSIDEPPRIRLELYRLADFGAVDEALNARLPVGPPAPELTADFLRAANVECDVVTLSMDLASYDLTTEPCPPKRATSNVLPALHWR